MKSSEVTSWVCAVASLVCVTAVDASAFGVGDTVKVIANTNVRIGPGTGYDEIKDSDCPRTARAGMVGKITAGPQSANGYTWWKVDFGPGLYSGWAIQNGLQVTAPAKGQESPPAGQSAPPSIQVPSPTSPGTPTESGLAIETFTPTLRWAAVSGADYYALAISEYPYGRSHIVHNPQRINGTTYPIPSGLLKPDGKYRWNVQAHTPAGFGDISPALYFQTKAAHQAVNSQQSTTLGSAPATTTPPVRPSPWMGNQQIEKAIQWAEDRQGMTYAKDETSDKGDFYYYSCMAFVTRAYTRTGTAVQPHASASAGASQLNARQNHQLTPPPRGVWVFYDWATDGHVALSLGDGNVIHCLTKTTLATVRKNKYDRIDGTTYIGWAWPRAREAGQEETEGKPSTIVSSKPATLNPATRETYAEKIQKLRRLFADPASFPQPLVPLAVRARQPELIEKSDSLYLAALDYQFLSLRCLRYAENFLGKGDTPRTDAYIAKAQRYYSVATALRRDSQAVADGTQSAVETELDGVRNACQTAVTFGLGVTNPTAAKAVEYIYTGVDYGVECAILGRDEAAKNAAKQLLVRGLFEEVRFPMLGDKTLDEYLKNRIGKGIFPIVDGVLKSEEAKFAILRIIKDTGIGVSEEILLRAIPEGGPVSTRQSSNTAVEPPTARTSTLRAKTGTPALDTTKPVGGSSTQQPSASQKSVDGAKLRQLPPHEQAAAAKLWERTEAARRNTNIRLISETSKRRMVDLCRQIIRQYPDTEYASKAKQALASLPEKDRKRYAVTDQEIGVQR